MDSWTTPFNASRFGTCCPQGGFVAATPATSTDPYVYSEDCLHLNIWAPRFGNQKGLPVLIYIHGGGFMMGCSSFNQYHGRHFAASLNTIVVTLNYRLGVFGFLAGRGLAGNYGIKDQQMAFMWVQKNIAMFGGDPDKVTIDGQSAGAMSVATHLALPSSQQLRPFRSAIIQSNPVLMQYRTMGEQDAQFDSMSSGAGCGFAADRLACLRQVPVTKLLDSQSWGDFPLLYNLTWQSVIHKMPWAPTIDGSFLPMSPSTAFETGNFYKVPIMIGTVANETVGFLPLVLGQGPSAPYVMATFYEVAVNTLFGKELANKIRALYPNNVASSEDAIARILTDFAFTCSVTQAATWTSQYVPTFVYQMSHAPGCDPDNFLWNACKGRVCHSADVDFVFHTIDVDRRGNCAWTSEEKNLSWQMAFYWSNFTASAPNEFNALPRWNQGQVTTQFDIPISFSQNNAANAHCDFWAKVVAGTA